MLPSEMRVVVDGWRFSFVSRISFSAMAPLCEGDSGPPPWSHPLLHWLLPLAPPIGSSPFPRTGTGGGDGGAAIRPTAAVATTPCARPTRLSCCCCCAAPRRSSTSSSPAPACRQVSPSFFFVFSSGFQS